MKFRSRRDPIVNLLIYGSIAIMIAPLFPMINSNPGAGSVAIAIFCLLIIGFLLWMLYDTWYEIDSTHITYHSGPLKGKIAIDRIHTVISGKSLYVGFRPATANKGVIVKYGKYDEIYFSPKTNESFITELLRIKPGIKVELH